MLNQIILRSRLGKSYRVHASENGVLPKGLKPLSFSDRNTARQFLESLNVGLSFWQPILQKYGVGVAYSFKNQSLDKVADYLVQQRFQIIEVPDENRLAASVQKRSIKLPSGELIQFFAASEMLTKKGAQKKQFTNQSAAKEFIQKNTQSSDQLKQVLTAADIPFAPSDSEEILSDKAAEAILQEKLFISTSKPIARPPEPKDSAPPAAGPRPVELAPPPPRTWIEVVLKDDKGEPISGEDYWILDPEGNEHTGKTDGAGMARVDGILSGYCQVAFPNIDGAGIQQCAAGVDCCTPAEEVSSPPAAEPANQAEEENTEEVQSEDDVKPEEEVKPETENQPEISTTNAAESPFVEEQTYKVDLEMTEANGRGAKKTPYKATLADGSTREGELDDEGKATIENIPSGAVEVEFGEEVVEQEIIDLRNQIKSVLHDVVEAEKKETAEIEAKLAEMNVVEEWWEYKKAELRGYYNFTVGVLTFAKDVMDFSPLHQAERAIASAWDAWMSSDEQPFLDAFAQKFTDAQMKELVDLIGVDPRTISKEDIAQVWAIANLIWDDADTRKILMDFAWDYIKAQHPLEMTESGAEVALEIAFDVLITALTAGVGATVVAASKLKHLSKLRKIGSVLKELADKLRKKALRKKTSGSAGGKVSAGADKPPVFDKTPNNASPKPEKPVSNKTGEEKEGVDSDPKHKTKYYDLNHQGIPNEYLDEVAEATGRTRKEIENLYDNLESAGVDYKSFIDQYVKNNPHGIDVKEAHLIMGYTTNFFMKGRLAPKMIKGETLSSAEKKLVASINSALDKLPSQSGTFYRGLGKGPLPDWFDEKYAEGRVLEEPFFASVSETLSAEYEGGKVMVFHANNVKDLSDLAMDVNFPDKIGQVPAKSEHLIPSGHMVRVISNDGQTVVLEQL